jgi:hypothetical protein
MGSWARFLVAGLLALAGLGAERRTPGPLDPQGRIHIPIGIVDSIDTLKTFVEPEGCFSPGVGSYGVYFWVHDGNRLHAPASEGMTLEHGLSDEGYLIPWSLWSNGIMSVRSEVCQVERGSPSGKVQVVAARIVVANTLDKIQNLSLYVAVRPIGPAGGNVASIAVDRAGRVLMVDGRSAVVSDLEPSAAGVSAKDDVGEWAMAGRTPAAQEATGQRDSSGCLRFDLAVPPGETQGVSLICPVLPGRRVMGHRWDGRNPWAQLDDAPLHPGEGGVLQPDPGVEFYRSLKADALFAEAEAYWKGLVGRVRIEAPDERWGRAFAAITGHLAMCMNEGAPDVAVLNYNVFNRDGVYTASMFQKAGRPDLAAKAIDYFLRRPFNGRIYPEADNPGQVLWIMGEHWRFTRDKAWLERVYPSLRKLAAMVRYYRMTPGPHWVAMEGIDFGDAVPKEQRRELRPGTCDGYHPEYTEAFDVAGMRYAAELAAAAGERGDAAEWGHIAEELFWKYDARFGRRVAREYGSYCVLWPCRVYLFETGKGLEVFKGVGAQKLGSWRYFPLATAHQGLLAGNRAAGHGTLEEHLRHEQMRGWYAFDEGGPSGAGAWRHVATGALRSNWPVFRHGSDALDGASVAMPHGWAVAELALLLRDSLVYEDEQRLVLLGGVAEGWFKDRRGIGFDLPTHFGRCAVRYRAGEGGATLEIAGDAAPPRGFVLKLPPGVKARALADGRPAARNGRGEVLFPAGTQRLELRSEPAE